MGRPVGEVAIGQVTHSSRVVENFVLFRVSVRLAEGGNCKKFPACRRIPN